MAQGSLPPGASSPPPSPSSPPSPLAQRSCIQCGAPVGASGGRCPFCGKEQPTFEARPGEAAPVGLSAHMRMQTQARRPIQITVVKARTSVPIMGYVGLAVIIAAVIGGAFVFVRSRPVPAPVATVVPTLAAPTATSSVAGVPIVDANRVDPTDMLPAMRRRLVTWSSDPQLIEITISHSQKGVVDLASKGTQVTYRYAPGPQTPRSPRGADGKNAGMLVTLRENAPAPEQAPIGPNEKVVPEPNCVWSAAWRAAVKAGVPNDVPVDGRYASLGRSGEPLWQVSVPGQPSLTRDIDGMTCSIKAR